MLKIKKPRRQKRVTFPILLLRGLLAAGLISVLFAGGFKEYMISQMSDQAEKQLSEAISDIQKTAAEINTKPDMYTTSHMNELSSYMGLHLNYNISFDMPLLDRLLAVQLTPRCSERGHVLSAIVDESGNITASNRLAMLIFVSFGEDDPDKGLYRCDMEDTFSDEVKQVYSDHKELLEKCGSDCFIEIELNSIYINRRNRTFVPREGKMTLYKVNSAKEVLYEDSEKTVLEERDINITECIDGVVMGVNGDSPPYLLVEDFYGETEDIFFRYSSPFVGYTKNGYTSFERNEFEDGRYSFCRSEPIFIDDRTYMLHIRYIIDFRDPQVTRYYRVWTAAFCTVTLVVTLLICWRRNVMNKAKYYFEDYQRDLTNHLAHDIKTPLTAIGGYTENIIEGGLTDEEEHRYLTSILDNIAFTDSIINRTLLLNSIEGKKIKREKQSAESVIEAALRKYDIMLDEKRISYSIKGSAEVTAERGSFETVIENLISNAVKYTPEGGSIVTEVSRKQIVIANTVSERTETKELMRPFVRGDKARSNTQGSGLGLSIAEKAALANGFRLKISCTENEFRADLGL